MNGREGPKKGNRVSKKPVLRYDETALVSQLDLLQAPVGVAFAFACAERIVPAYRAFHALTGYGDPLMLESTLELLWKALEDDSVAKPALEQHIQACDALFLKEDAGSPWLLHSAANDALAAVYYGIRCWRTGEAQEAAWAARRVYEALDRAVIERSGIDVNAGGAERTILEDSLIQAELERQARDLTELRQTEDRDVASVFRRLRERARKEGQETVAALVEIARRSRN